MTTHIGPLDSSGELAHLRASSIHNVEVAYGRWLAWLGTHEPTALDEAPIPRVTCQRVRLWMDAVRECAPYSRKLWIDGLIRFLTAAEPDVEISLLRGMQRHLLQLANEDYGSRKIDRIPSSFDLIEAALT